MRIRLNQSRAGNHGWHGEGAEVGWGKGIDDHEIKCLKYLISYASIPLSFK